MNRDTRHDASRARVLISAYACEPGKGSEPEVGWRGSRAISDLHDVCVLTRQNNRDVILSQLQTRPSLEFYFFDLPGPFVWLKRVFRCTLAYYVFWHIGSAMSVRKKLFNFQVFHHLTFNAFQMPGFWWFSKPAVVLGPLGGGQICPWRLLPFFRGDFLKEAFRSVVVLLSGFNPLVFTSFYFAKIILVANRDTEKRLPCFFRHKARRLLETAIDTTRTEPLPEPEGPSFRFLLLGRLEKRKGGELAIRAFGRIAERIPDASITIAGSGPDDCFLRSMTDSLGLSDRIFFVGRVEREKLESLFADHHVFLFPSLRDTSGNVVLEAMSFGRPVVALNHQGVAEIATDQTAILVEPGNIDETIDRFGEAMLALASHAEKRRSMGEAGLDRVKTFFSWKRYSVEISKVYGHAIAVSGKGK